VERLWQWLKRDSTLNRLRLTLEAVAGAAEAHMRVAAIAAAVRGGTGRRLGRRAKRPEKK
jgi:hypothetical protein